MNNTSNRYNKWSSYPTWRVWTDILSGITFEEKVNEDDLLEIVHDVVTRDYKMESGSHLVEDYAAVFVSLANYYEIAEMINEDIQTKYE